MTEDISVVFCLQKRRMAKVALHETEVLIFRSAYLAGHRLTVSGIFSRLLTVGCTDKACFGLVVGCTDKVRFGLAVDCTGKATFRARFGLALGCTGP